MCPQEILDYLSSKVGKIQKVSSVHGGCINQAVCLETNDHKFFLKWNTKDNLPNVFEKEVLGLNVLREKSSLIVPSIIDVGESDNYSFLALEWLQETQISKRYWEKMGKGFAELHQNTETLFGISYDNYIGSLSQKNTQFSDWKLFFIEQRLFNLATQSLQQNLLSSKHIIQLENLISRLDNIFPANIQVSLLHGDLWSGNVMPITNAKVAIFDAAVYWGNREMDIAFSTLFGGFDQQFYNTYDEYLPLEKGFKERIPILNLYPLFVHLLLFGKAYLQDIEQVLRKF